MYLHCINDIIRVIEFLYSYSYSYECHDDQRENPTGVTLLPPASCVHRYRLHIWPIIGAESYACVPPRQVVSRDIYTEDDKLDALLRTRHEKLVVYWRGGTRMWPSSPLLYETTNFSGCSIRSNNCCTARLRITL